MRRDLRRFEAGWESSFLYHRARRLIVPLVVTSLIIFLSNPPTTATAATFKKIHERHVMTTRFAHRASFLPMPYQYNDERFLVFKKAGPPTESDIDTFLADNPTRGHMTPFEDQGFGIGNVQAALEGAVRQGPASWNFAYPVTAGFMMFRKRIRVR